MEKISDKKISKFKKIGYLETLPENANLNEYEKISILIKQKTITLYRNINNKQKIDDTSNFGSSWEVFNSLI